MHLGGHRGAGAGAGATVLGRPCVHAATRLTPLLSSAGCQGLWDNTSCWPSSAPGQTVEVACPRFLWMLVGRNGNRPAQGPSWEAVGRPPGWAWAWRRWPRRLLWRQGVSGRVGVSSLGIGSLDWGGAVWPQLSGRQARGLGAADWGSGEGGQACFSLPSALIKGLPSSLPRFCPLSARGPCSSPRGWVTPGPGWPSRTLTSPVPSRPGPAGELWPPWKLLAKLQFIRVPFISGKEVRRSSQTGDTQGLTLAKALSRARHL